MPVYVSQNQAFLRISTGKTGWIGFLLSLMARYLIQVMEPPRTVLGRSNPKQAVGLPDAVHASLTLYGRGACDACPGLSSLKVVGTGLLGLLTPRSPGLGVKSKRGRTAIDFRRGNFMNRIMTIVAAAFLAGCVSMGTNYDEAAVSRLQKGMSKAEVIQLLGQPNQVITTSDGGQRLVWVHSTGSMFGANARSVGLPFDNTGKLTDVPK